MKHKLYLFSVLCLMLLLGSCSKSSDPAPSLTPVQQVAAKFTEVNWLLDRINSRGINVIDNYPDLGLRGMKILFRKDFQYQVLTIGTATFSFGSWVLENEKTLTVNSLPMSFGKKATFNIKSLTANEFILEIDYQTDPNDIFSTELLELVFKK